MDRKRRTDAERARIAQGWRESGLAQPVYAAQHGITDRTLRAWLVRWAPPCSGNLETARKVVRKAIERLEALAVAMECGTGAELPGAPTGMIITDSESLPI